MIFLENTFHLNWLIKSLVVCSLVVESMVAECLVNKSLVHKTLIRALAAESLVGIVGVVLMAMPMSMTMTVSFMSLMTVVLTKALVR